MSTAIKSAVKPRYYARRGFLYAGTPLHPGQVLTLVGAVNDDKLVRLKYVTEVPPHAECYTCAECGAEFVGMGERQRHGKEAHRPSRYDTLDPRAEDARLDREEKRLAQDAPLALEHTLAAQK